MEPKSRARKRRRSIAFSLLGTTSLVAVLPFLGAALSPAEAALPDMSLLAGPLNSLEVIWFAAFVGAVAFGVASAIGIVRIRRRTQARLERLITENGDLKLRLDRLEGVLDTDDQRLVVWPSRSAEPIVLGGLNGASGAPRSPNALLAFGTWLQPDSAVRLEGLLEMLRENGAAFTLTLQAREGGFIEASGRTAGGWAVLRLRDLTGERARHADLTHDHARLNSDMTTLKALLDTLDGPVWLRDSEGHISWVNRAYAAAVEADAESAVEQDIELLDAAGRRAMTEERDDDGQFKARLPVVAAGRRHVFDVIDVTQSSGSAGLALDTSELEQMRAELKRTLEFHARTLDQLATAVAIFGPDRRLQFHNAAFQTLFGLDTAFLEGGPEDGAVLDAMRAARKLPEQADYRQWQRKHLESYQSLEPREVWWHLPDGQTLRVIANPHAKGGVTYIYENVTERIELESRYNALIRVQGETLDHLTEAVAVFGSDGRLRLWNPAFTSFWQLQEEDLSESPHVSTIFGTCARLFSDPQAWKGLTTTITGLADNRARASGRMQRPDGNVLDYTTVPLPDGGTLVGFVNVTDSVNVERALMDKNEALREADQLKNTFVQHVSYELRSPLTNIIGFAQLLSDPKFGTLTEKQSEYTDYIMSSSSALLAIINDILDLATIDAGIMELDLGEVEIADVVTGAIEGLKDRLVDTHIDLRVDVPKDIGTFVADERRLRQVLFNLISNAIRYSDEGGVVELACTRTGSEIRFVVRDHGCGIAKENIDTVFSRFVGHTSGSRRRGAGLGLAIVRSFVELHGGSVEIQSEENVGTTVIAKFPQKPKVRECDAAE
ncbi:PAS domain-containing sensor histidine kinase [Breoghania sp.]|uniref:sensor histidine kinase n=1 Tax=Breoghania sp. TaxID=2065378 RepID=UPI002625E7D1|nr:PAS domain-containing sensor histidine kinase [Breoghania sp.]MDJ0931026.1 PAS-domain containing protein [Breoghania sp.]